MAHFVDQGGCDAAADHPLARNPDHRDWILAASWEPSPRSPDRRAHATIEVADHRRGLVIPRQGQGVRRYDVKARQPDALFGFATLGDDLVEEVELRQHGIEPQPQKYEPALGFGGGGAAAFAPQPVEELPYAPLEFAPSIGEKPLDSNLSGRQ